MRRGEVYRTRERVVERGDKPGFYVIVSRQFILDHEDVSTVICAPVYGEILGVTTEVVIGEEEGLPRTSAVRCDFLMLMFKHKLKTLAGRLSLVKLRELDGALARALDLPDRV
ncbi:MAG: type II toxin-antitoxin system PemK/MazF family toxin [Acidobacteria bacterium]|nr:type II toxin-antitoxin system PemK/MazF family toxin [Acidobacteriota bacterium]